MATYEHLTGEKRHQIYSLKKQGKSLSAIAELLKVHRSTVWRELKRNHGESGEYVSELAHQKALGRRNKAGSKIERDRRLQKLIRKYLTMAYSPEAIAGRLKKEFNRSVISHESIYKWLYGEGYDLRLYTYLKRRKKKRGVRPCRKATAPGIPDRVSIHERPSSFLTEFGHWEGDTVIFSGREGAMVTLYERSSKLFLATTVPQKTSACVTDALARLLEVVPAQARRSLTLDNGSEFVGYRSIAPLFSDRVYFADPYSAWQKGGVENANGILRRFIPKGSHAYEFPERRVQSIIRQINSLPRKSLDFSTPLEAFTSLCHSSIPSLSSQFLDVALRV